MGESTLRYRPRKRHRLMDMRRARDLIAPGGSLGRPDPLQPVDLVEPGTSYPGADPAQTYWRRRFFILVIGLAVFALAAWSLSQALMVSPGSGTLARKAGSGSHPGPGSEGPGSRGRAGGVLQPSPSPRATSPLRSPSPSPGTGLPATPSPSPSSAGHVSGTLRPAFCAAHAVVLSLASRQASFGHGKRAGFSVSVVSTAKTACSFNLGSRHLALVIRRGSTRIWSSADCAKGVASLVAPLRRGVPAVVSVSWGRRTSSPGCSGPSRLVTPGQYTGYAVDGSLVSAPVRFRLS